MRHDVLEQLIDRDPQTLFDSDVALTGPEQRERLLTALVQGVNSGSVIITRWHAKDEFRKLFFPGIEEPLRRFLADRSLGEQARRIVVDVIRDCKVRALAEQLAVIALDRTEPELLRVSAAWGVRDLDGEKARKLIKPLVHAAATESSLSPQSIDDLRGCGLASTWRDYIGIEELLRALSKPLWDGLGGYKMFLGDFAQQLEVAELPQAFEWLDSQKDWGEQHWELETIEQQLLEKAWANLEHRDALACFSRHAVQHLSRSRSIFGEHVSPDVVSERVSAQIRRRLALDTILSTLDETATGAELARLLRYTGLESLILSEDFLWYLDQIRLSADNETVQERWVRVAFQRYDPSNVGHTQLLWNLREEGVGGPLLARAFEAIALDSEEADQERPRWEAFYSDNDPDPIDDTQPFVAQSQIVQFLKDIEDGKTDAWWRLDFWLQVDGSRMHRRGVDEWETDIRTFPGWAQCDESIRAGIVNGADAYVRTSQPNSRWFGTLDHWRPDLAGFRAFVLLQEEDPALFQNIPASVWRKWGPLFLAFPPRNNSDEIPFQRLLLTQAVTRGFEVIDTLRVIAEREGGESTYIFSSALKAACAVSDEAGRALLAAEFINVKWGPTIVQEAVRELVEVRNDPNAARLAVPVAQDFAKDKNACASGAQVAGYVLANRADLYWDDFWPTILESKEFRYGILTFMLWHDRRDYKLFAQLTERQLGYLYLTLAQEFPPKEDPEIQGVHQIDFREDIGRWRESVLSHLAQRGTWAAGDKLIKLSVELPEIDWIRVRAAQARELARSATWQPPTSDDLMEIVRAPEKRIVESDGQLQEVLLESLARLQKELQAETPAAAYYWNHPNDREANPKDEKEISDYIKRHLDQYLAQSGIVINREVENRRKNITDIYAEASRIDDQSTADVITVVCEVKGCWNRELYTAQKEQLLDRYLVENGHTHGIYIAAYFDGNRWQKSDRSSRHKNCKKHTVDELREELTIQSQNLSGDGKVLRTVVLDMNF